MEIIHRFFYIVISSQPPTWVMPVLCIFLLSNLQLHRNVNSCQVILINHNYRERILHNTPSEHITFAIPQKYTTYTKT